MAGYGIPQDDIARVFGIHAETLRKHYRDELDLGSVKATTAVAQNLFKIATGTGREAITAAIFWLKTRAGWSEANFHAAAFAREVEPPAPKPPKLGKKEIALDEARTAHIDSEWGEDLRPLPTTRH